MRLDTAAPAAGYVAAEEGAQDRTDTEDASAAVEGVDAVQLQPVRLHKSVDERTEKEVPQMHRRTGLSGDRSSLEA